MATKFSLDPEPTFETTVTIPVPGGSAPVKWRFKFFDREQYVALFSSEKPLPDDELVLAITDGWGLADEFSSESVRKLLNKYQKAASAIVSKFVDEIGPARLGN